MVEDANGSKFLVGARVMFTGPYGVSEDRAYSEYLAVRKENLSLIPGNIDDVSAAGIPMAYFACQRRLGRQCRHTVGKGAGSRRAMSTTTSHESLPISVTCPRYSMRLIVVRRSVARCHPRSRRSRPSPSCPTSPSYPT